MRARPRKKKVRQARFFRCAKCHKLIHKHEKRCKTCHLRVAG
jgi:RNA polymerase subunit RPABC4/transcription elongation factor Spt4